MIPAGLRTKERENPDLSNMLYQAIGQGGSMKSTGWSIKSKKIRFSSLSSATTTDNPKDPLIIHSLLQSAINRPILLLAFLNTYSARCVHSWTASARIWIKKGGRVGGRRIFLSLWRKIISQILKRNWGGWFLLIFEFMWKSSLREAIYLEQALWTDYVSFYIFNDIKEINFGCRSHTLKGRFHIGDDWHNFAFQAVEKFFQLVLVPPHINVKLMNFVFHGAPHF